MKYLVVGLGNIGAQYIDTRHNIGFHIIEELAEQHQASFQLKKLGYITQIKHKAKQVYLLKPTTLMNLSGQSVQYWLQKCSLKKDKLLIVTDDIHLKLGAIRLRTQGGCSGHNGIAHIIQKLKTKQFNRLRCGIGNHFLPGQQADYVLSKFTTQELSQINEMTRLAINAIKDFICQPIAHVMNIYNRRRVTPN